MRCSCLSTCHCPGSCTAEGNPIRSWGRRARPTFRGKATGRGETVARSRWTRARWTGPLSWAEGPAPGCTVTATAACPAGGPEPAAAAAGTRRASLWPSASRWRGTSTGYSPWRQRPRTEAGPEWEAVSPGRGTHWWSSSFSSTWPVCFGTRPEWGGGLGEEDTRKSEPG